MGPHQGFAYMLLTFKLLKLFHKPVVLLCDVHVCYGTAVEHRCLLIRSGICEELFVVIFFCSYSRFEDKHSISHNLTSLYKECQRYGKGHQKIGKMRIRDTNIYIFDTVGFCICNNSYTF
jgi:hypothetical protein